MFWVRLQEMLRLQKIFSLWKYQIINLKTKSDKGTLLPATVDVIHLVVLVEGYSLEAVCKWAIQYSDTCAESNKGQL